MRFPFDNKDAALSNEWGAETGGSIASRTVETVPMTTWDQPRFGYRAVMSTLNIGRFQGYP